MRLRMKRYRYANPNPKTGVKYVDILDDGAVVFHTVDGKSLLTKFPDPYRNDVEINSKYTEVEFDFEKV